MEEDDSIDVIIDKLDPDLDTLYYVLAHRWMQDRPRYFLHNGGYSLLQAYIDNAKQNGQLDFGIFVDGEMLSLVTIVKEKDGGVLDGYLFHVTSPKRAKAEIITKAVYQLGWSLFDKLKADYIYTMVPTFNGHVHRGSQKLAESCGLTATGIPETEEDRGWTYSWQPYVLRRKDWLEKHHGQAESSTVTV